MNIIILNYPTGEVDILKNVDIDFVDTFFDTDNLFSVSSTTFFFIIILFQNMIQYTQMVQMKNYQMQLKIK